MAMIESVFALKATGIEIPSFIAALDPSIANMVKQCLTKTDPRK